MKRIAQFAMSAIVAGLACGSAFGGLSINPVNDPNVPEGCVACEIIWEGGADWTSAALVIDLTSGSVYQNVYGGDAAPNPALFAVFPELEFDTYVGIIGDGTAGIAGGAGDLGGGPLSLNAPQISVSWFNTATDDTGPVRIAMITLTDDARGTWSMLSGGVITQGTLILPCIPEPTSLGLLGLGGLALLRRR